MKTLHTPAPWQALPSPNNFDSAKVVAPESNSKVICWVFTTDAPNRDRVVNTRQDRANISLIAAAPDLLAICEEIANDSKCDLVNSERRIRLYSALSKAKGEHIK
jgi:hypothetical protein